MAIRFPAQGCGPSRKHPQPTIMEVFPRANWPPSPSGCRRRSHFRVETGTATRRSRAGRFRRRAGQRSARRFPGSTLCFHDVTRLKQLESIRKEFVGNVSHDCAPRFRSSRIRQTLLDGAMAIPSRPPASCKKLTSTPTAAFSHRGFAGVLLVNRAGRPETSSPRQLLRDMAPARVDTSGAWPPRAMLTHDACPWDDRAAVFHLQNRQQTPR